MIRARLFCDSEGFCTGYRIEGHAGYAENDADDIVCAAVSVLAVTCCNTLERVLGKAPEARQGDGLLEVHLAGKASRESEIIFRFLREGLEELQETYPAYVSLKVL